MAAGHGGQTLLSEATRRLAGDDLEVIDLGEQRLKDLTGSPSGSTSSGRASFPPLLTLNRTNLPVAANPLLGRDQELSELTKLLTNGAVVTITGPGGTGKTRLALQVAGELVESFRDGVFWVPVAALRDPALVLPSIAQALGAKEDLADHLRDRQALVLVDNLEHLLDAAASLADLPSRLRSRAAAARDEPFCAPHRRRARVPARSALGRRSRSPLRRARPAGRLKARGLRDRPRDLPARRQPSSRGRAGRRAGQAPRPEGLLSRLEQRLPLLTGGRRDLPERQQTLRATIEWSHDLMPAEERQLFRRLAVFRGGFTPRRPRRSAMPNSRRWPSLSTSRCSSPSVTDAS